MIFHAKHRFYRMYVPKPELGNEGVHRGLGTRVKQSSIGNRQSAIGSAVRSQRSEVGSRQSANYRLRIADWGLGTPLVPRHL
ncbi:MAG: hypothetical protein M5U24_17375 [Candidatus Kuenenia sp.]|uniref:hypothetical protein n=1 Tax=Candidatus Kuenenia sp. TaxID=2499824 RepID=UPI0022C4C086|nr:hypothetical protein [Candidatus Kuenenia sp.]MCZ7624217.1 hypothetical protein [Candidatus Kuenenia sp.]